VTATPTHARPAAWAVLAVTGGTTLTFNVWHATHAGHMLLPLALLYGLAPVLAAMGLSHIVAAHQGGTFMKGTAFAVMAGAMALSMGATASVLRPAAGPWFCWLFGIVIDAAALVALQVILSPESRAAAKAARRAAHGAIAGAVPGAAVGPQDEPREGPATGPADGPSDEPGDEPRQRAIRVSKEPDAEKARAAYRKSLRAGQPLSDRAVGEMFSRSRNWGAARIREVGDGPRLADPAAAVR
jgi:hypothetical protein